MAWYKTRKASKLRNMDRSKILVFDTETTGLGDLDEIIQLSILDGYGSTLFDSYIRPKHKRVWPGAQAVNHISYKMVKDYPTFEECRNEVQDIFNEAEIIVGYNVNFDIRFIEKAGIIVSGTKFDVMTEFARYHADIDNTVYKNCSLKACADYFGYSFSAHDSAQDAEATLYCFDSLLDDPRFTAYERRERKRLKEESKETYIRKRTKFSIQFRSMNIPVFIKGLIMVAVGEGIWYLGNQSFLQQISEYAEAIKSIIATRPVNILACIAVILIGLGCLRFIYGTIRAVIRIPKWIMVKAKRLFK